MPTSAASRPSTATIEIELKLRVPAAGREPLLARLRAFGPPRLHRLESVYFDTPEATLRKAGAALRLRRDDSRGPWRQTLKTAGGGGALSQRGEWEHDLPGRRPDLDVLAQTPLAPLLVRIDPAQLKPQFLTRIERQVWHLAHAGADLEIALDEGVVRAGRTRLPIAELEIEVLRGPPSAALDLALQLACAEPPLALRPATESKAQRGWLLVQQGRAGKPPPASAALAGQACAGSGGLAADLALKRLAAATLNTVLANIDGMIDGSDPEYAHQSRVVLRRLRDGIKALAPEVAFPPACAGELRWLAQALGGLRDVDVLQHQTLPSLLAGAGLAPGRPRRLEQALRASRRAAGSQLGEVLASPRFAAFALQLLAWTLAGPSAKSTLAEMGQRALARARDKYLQTWRRDPALPSAARHPLRLRAKRWRNLGEWLAMAGAIKAEGAHQRQMLALKEILAQLGADQDLLVADQWLAAQALAAPAKGALRQEIESRRKAAERQLRARARRIAAAIK